MGVRRLERQIAINRELAFSANRTNRKILDRQFEKLLKEKNKLNKEKK